tara:strand:- start:287 stop:1477 length:1191 start_codon:yes stop_codon:yes gene_type:complete
MKLGYELKLKDSFVPNGTPPKVIDIMKTKDDPLSVFYNGCYIDEFKLQSPVYQQLHILDWYDASKTPYEERLVDDLVDEKYYYAVSPFGTANGFIGLSNTQINWDFTNSISQKVLGDIEKGLCKIVIDKVSEGHPYQKHWIEKLHSLLENKNIPRDKVIFVTSNNRFLDDYKKDFKNRIDVIEWTHHELEILLTYDFVGGWKNKMDVERSKHFISLNHGKKRHRTSLIDTIINNNLQEKGYFSYVSKGITLDIGSEEDRQGDNDVLVKWFAGLNHLYADSYFNFTTETLFHEQSIRFSEKIFKPILYQQPFLMYSSPLMLKKFKELGYKTFDEWFDESYDEEVDDDKRLKILNDEVVRLCSLSLDDVRKIFLETREVSDYNIQHLLNLKNRIQLPL